MAGKIVHERLKSSMGGFEERVDMLEARVNVSAKKVENLRKAMIFLGISMFAGIGLGLFLGKAIADNNNNHH